MVQTISKIFVKESKEYEFIELFKEMIEPTQKEVGYIQYEMYQDSENSEIFIVLERWETRESFNKHLQSEHFEKIVPKMMKLMEKETELNIAHKVA
ncbi:putative quinol monooxygenase [Mycoplasmatota bacterium zrk1]